MQKEAQIVEKQRLQERNGTISFPQLLIHLKTFLYLYRISGAKDKIDK
jgi:hypothetical protein